MRNTSTNDSRSTIPESSLAIGNVGNPIPVQYQQLVSDVPTGTKSEVTPSFVKLTQKSPMKQIRRTSTFATYSLNVPLDNQLISVSAIAKVVKNMAETYDRQHQDSFFQAWPDLIIRSESETEEFTTAYLRTHIKKFARRLAHYYVQYVNYRKYWICSLINIVNLAKLQGDGLIKKFSEACKWGYINTNTNIFSRFPDPIGFTDGMTAVAKHAVGKTNYGSDILAFPMINVDIWGNRGYQSLPVDNLIAIAGGDGTEGSSLDVDSEQGEAAFAKGLIQNMRAVISEYTDFTNTTITSQKKTRQWAPYMPRFENGPRLNLVEMDSHGDPMYYESYQMNILNLDNMLENVDPECPLASIMWNNLKYWEAQTLKNFPEMMDVNSDLRTFAETQLHYVTESKKVQDIYNAVYNAKNVDMNEIAKAMCLKKNNKVNTATIVRWAPLIGGTKGTARSTEFTSNFERYDVFNTNTASILRQAKSVPDLTPTTFSLAYDQSVQTDGDAPCYPIVLNACPAMADEINPKAGSGYPQITNEPGIYGKYATYFDMASSVSLDPTVTNIISHGVDKSWIESFVKAGDGVVFEEDPTMVRALYNPVFETNDLFMSGFGLLVANESDNPAASDTTKFYRDENNFNGVGDAPIIDDTHDESCITIGDVNYRMHTSVKPYLDKIKFGIIFMGEGIFNHPLINPALKGAGVPTYTLYGGGNETATEYRKTKVINDLGSITGTAPINNISYLASRGSFRNGTIGETSGLSFSSSTPKYFMLMHFDPNYGPVKPITYDDAIADIVPMDIFAGAYNEVNVNTAVQPKFNKEYVAADFFTPTSIASRPLYDSTRSIAKQIVPAITSFVIMPATVDSDGTARVAFEIPPKPLWLSGVWDYMRSLLTKVTTQFTGLEDTVPFWSHKLVEKIGSAIEIPIVSECNAAPKQEIQVAPRVPNSRQLGKKPGFNNFRAKVEPVRSESSMAADALGGDSSDKDLKAFRGSKKRHGRRHPSKFNTSKTSADGVSKDSNFGTDALGVGSLANSASVESAIGFDKDKRKADDKTLQAGIQA